MKLNVFIVGLVTTFPQTIFGDYSDSRELNDEVDWNPAIDECSLWEQCNPTIHETPNFKVKTKTIAFREALIRKDSTKIIDILTKSNQNQRMNIILQYYKIYGTDLFDKIEKNLIGNFKKLVMILIKPLEFFYVDELKTCTDNLPAKLRSFLMDEFKDKFVGVVAGASAKTASTMIDKMKKSQNISSNSTVGILTDTLKDNVAESSKQLVNKMIDDVQNSVSDSTSKPTVIIEILAPLSVKGVVAVRTNFKRRCAQDLIDVLLKTKTSLSTEFKAFLPNFAGDNKTDEYIINSHSVQEDVETLEIEYKEKGTILHNFKNIVQTRNPRHIRELSIRFQGRTGCSLEHSLNKAPNTELREILISLMEIKIDRADYFARKLKESLNKQNVDHKTLSRIIVSRSEIDLGRIMVAFSRINDNKSLPEAIKEKCSGDYRDALLRLLGD